MTDARRRPWFEAFRRQDLHQVTPLVFEPDGLVPVVVDVGQGTEFWTSTVGNPHVAVLLNLPLRGHIRLPQTVIGRIAGFVPASVFFIKSTNTLMYCSSGGGPLSPVNTLCVCTQNEAHALAVHRSLYFAPHPERAVWRLMNKLQQAGTSVGVRGMWVSRVERTLLLTPFE